MGYDPVHVRRKKLVYSYQSRRQMFVENSSQRHHSASDDIHENINSGRCTNLSLHRSHSRIRHVRRICIQLVLRGMFVCSCTSPSNELLTRAESEKMRKLNQKVHHLGGSYARAIRMREMLRDVFENDSVLEQEITGP